MNSLTLLFALGLLGAEPKADKEAPKPVAHETIQVEGWTVYVDQRLRSEPDAKLGKQALGLLEAHLRIVAITVAPRIVERLRKVPFQLDRTHGALVSPQYHPSAGWLTEHGYDKALAKRVHIPDASYFVQPRFQHEQPSAALHELAHAYHDQVLKFDNSEIEAAWKAAKKSGRFNSVLHVNGSMREHYAQTNPQEFFAEMTESFLGHNDFYPFNEGELKKAEPEIHALMKKVWIKE